MSNLQVVDADVLEADLTSVADSIRTKTGGEEKLAFPSGFVSALDTIESADSALAEVEYMMSNGYTNYSHYFHGMYYLTIVPADILKHTEQGRDFEYMFADCNSLTEIPPLNTANGEAFNQMFSFATHLVTLGGINFSNATNVTATFNRCQILENLTINGVIKITGLDLSGCLKLTHDSLMSAINALYDWASEGTTGTFKLTLGSTNLAKLTDAEKAIATQKGWTLL